MILRFMSTNKSGGSHYLGPVTCVLKRVARTNTHTRTSVMFHTHSTTNVWEIICLCEYDCSLTQLESFPLVRILREIFDIMSEEK